jgi:hypothetical protein
MICFQRQKLAERALPLRDAAGTGNNSFTKCGAYRSFPV